MSTNLFLLKNKNLFDVENTNEARHNLGIGSMATYNSNNVLITGGNVSVDFFQLHTENAGSNKFLRCVDNIGTCDWYELPIFDWVDSNQSNVNLSQFSNDCNYVEKHTLCNVCFTGDFQDLTDVPTTLSAYYTHDDLSYRLLFRSSNLSDLEDVDTARSNLGLGNIAIQNTSNVFVHNLTIHDNLYLLNDNNYHVMSNGFLSMSNNQVVMKELPIADPITQNIGMVRITNSNINDSNIIPTTHVVHEQMSNVYNKINDQLNIVTNPHFINILESANVMFTSNNLSDLQNVEIARSNLLLGDMALQNSNNVHIGTLTVNQLYFDIENANDDNFIRGRSDGSLYWDSLPKASSTTYGTVILRDEIPTNDDDFYAVNVFDTTTVPTTNAVYHMYSNITSNLNYIDDSIIRNIYDLENHEDYLLRANNLSDLKNSETARHNLGLHNVAHTGIYTDIQNHPTKLSEFENDVHFLDSTCNLSDLTNITLARQNLGLGTMAIQNNDNVLITGGIAKFTNLHVTNSLMYKSTDNVQNKILQSIDPNGRVAWRNFPIASTTNYGAVKITHDITSEAHDVVPSCSLVQKLYRNLLEEVIVKINNM